MKKSFKPRNSGHYWVGWHLEPDGSVFERVGFYHESTASWSLPGTQRFFVDADFLSIDETPIIRAKPVRWYHKALRDTFTGLVFIAWTVFFASVIAIILTWLLKCK